MSYYYLIDIHHRPPMVVLVSPTRVVIDEVGQRYADQVGRALVLAQGEAPLEASFRPHVPDGDPVTPPGVSGVNLAPVVAPLEVGGLGELLAVAGLEDVWGLLRKLEPTAIQLLVQVLQALVKR